MQQRSAIFWHFLLIKKTLRPNSIVEIIIKATGFFFLRKFQKRSIYTQQKVAEKCKFWQFSLCGICLLFCSPLRSIMVLCGPLRSFAVFSQTRGKVWRKLRGLTPHFRRMNAAGTSTGARSSRRLSALQKQ